MTFLSFVQARSRSLALLVALSVCIGSLSATPNVASAAATIAPKPVAATSSNDSNSSTSLTVSHPTAVAGALSATVAYKAPKGASGLTYRVRYSSNKGKAWDTFGPTTSALSITVSGLTAGTSYIFEVSAKKTTTWGAWSDDSNAVKPTAGAAPSNYSIVASVTAGGSMSPTGTATVASGASQTYTITPNSGFQISSVQVDNASVGTVASYTFSNVTANHTILASFTAIGYSIVASAGSHGSISPGGSTTVYSGTSQSYTITPVTGYHVADVLVDSNSVGAVTTYTFNNVTASHTISVSFAINTYNIVASVDYGSGTISPNGTTSVNYGTNQTYTITPATGYRINDVIVDNASVGTPSSHTFSNVTANHTILVSFTIASYDIVASVDSGNGTISPTGTTAVTPGNNQTYTITPDAGWVINDIRVDGTLTSNTSSYTFSNVQAGHTIAVSFVRGTYTINSSIDYGSGSITPLGDSNVTGGGNKTYTITPDAGYEIDTLYVDGDLVTNINSYTFSNVTANHTIMVSFTLGTYTITAAVDAGNGSISPAGDSSVTGGGSKTYTITPDAGYIIDQILVDGTAVTNAGTYTFSNVVAGHSIHVSFVLGFNITASVDSGPGHISSNGVTAVASGSSKTYTFTPNANSFVSNVVVDGVSIGAWYSYTFSNVIEEHTIYVQFEANTYDLYADIDYGNGSVSPLHYHTVYNGDDQTYTFTPDDGFYVYNVIVDGVDMGGLDSYTFYNVKSRHEIWVQFEEIRDYTITASVDSGSGNISPSGATLVQVTTDKTFSFTADPGSHISDVVVDGVSKGAITSFTFSNVRTNHTIYVQFELDPYAGPTYTVTSYVNIGSGSISIDGTTEVSEGGDQTYDFTASNGWQVKAIYVDGVLAGASTSYTLYNVTEPHEIYVEFETQTVWLYSDISSGNGTVDTLWDVEVDRGHDFTFNFLPDDGWYVSGIFVNGHRVGAGPSYTFKNVQRYSEVYVQFKELTTFTISASAGTANGFITDDGDTFVDATGSWDYYFYADNGYHVDDVLVDGVSLGALESYTFNWVVADHTIVVSFAEDVTAPVVTNFTITYDSNGDHSGLSSSAQKQQGSGLLTLQANTYVATNAAHFFGWNTQANAKGTYYYPADSYDLQADVRLYAIWTFDITLNVGDLEQGPFSSAWATFIFPMVLDPNTNDSVTLTANSSQTVTVLAGALYPYDLVMTGTWSGTPDAYTGGYTVTLTNLYSWDPRVYMQNNIAEGGNTYTAVYVAVSPAGADGSVNINYTPPS
ncbi:MAG: hypothetical protein RL196_537 [Actinomycetota bacterium]|jgi:hypothetical protein